MTEIFRNREQFLEEEPEIEEVTGKEPAEFGSVECQNLSFAYEEEQILSDYSISIPKGSRIGLHGKTGRGRGEGVRKAD